MSVMKQIIHEPVGYFRSMVEHLNSGLPRENEASDVDRT